MIFEVGIPDIFKYSDGPAKFLKAKFPIGSFVYFMSHEITDEQFDELLKTGYPFAIIQPEKEGYITTCYNRIEEKTEIKTT